MADIDHIIEKLLGNRRISEGAAFSTRTFSDQPLIERGRDFKARLEKNERERAARIAEREARMAARRKREEKPRPDTSATHASYQQQLNDMLFPTSEGSRLRSTMGRNRPPRIEELPVPLREMRALERGGMPHSLAYGSSTAASLFLQQARLLEDYEDTYEFSGDFQQYYPTYASMTDSQLRGYFAWRTRVRAGNVTPAPLSFAFVYIYELLAGVGTTPGAQGLRDLRAFGTSWQATGGPQTSTPLRYLDQWLVDYAVYHDVVDELHGAASTIHLSQLVEPVVTLLRAEHAQLRAQGDEPRIPNPAVQGPPPSPEKLLEALGGCASYHLCDSRLAKAEPQLMAAIAADVFAALVTHCSRRRKTDFVEGLFGYAQSSWHTMFSGAVFYEEERHPDTTVEVGSYERYTCKNGSWEHWIATSARSRSKDLGAILHLVDCELRQQLDYPYPLKPRKDLPKYVQKIVHTAIAARLEERAEAERRRITIDLSQLAGIRAAAAVTQEALLTDEERGIEDTSFPEPVLAYDVSPAQSPATAPVAGSTGTASEDDGQISIDATQPAPTPTPAPKPSTQQTAPSPEDAEGLLTPLELRLMQGLLEGVPTAELLSPTDPFVSVVVDTINEKFFDIVGDAVIEFDGDDPCIIEDYLDDIREVLPL